MDTEKVAEVDRFRESDLFTDRERLTLELAERMTYTDQRVDDAFFDQLREEFSEEELVELAAVIALENYRSKFNPVFGIEANGFCSVPAVTTAVEQATKRLH